MNEAKDSVMKHEVLRDIALRSSVWMIMHSDAWRISVMHGTA